MNLSDVNGETFLPFTSNVSRFTVCQKGGVKGFDGDTEVIGACRALGDS